MLTIENGKLEGEIEEVEQESVQIYVPIQFLRKINIPDETE